MPDVAVHASFGREVLSSLPAALREEILSEPYTFGLFGPDPWFMHKPWLTRQGRGRQMHTTKPGAFLTALLRRTRAASSCRAELFSYLAGFFCHYALDSITHPYVIWVTADEYVFPRSHMSLEHALDIRQMERDGFWGTAHPVTRHYYPRLRLPAVMREDLDAVFEDVYGWKHCRRALNRSGRLYRFCYRLMESTRGFPAWLAGRTKEKSSLRSMIYCKSFFLSRDPENTEHRPWKHPFDPSLSFSDSFPELREKARARAVELIVAAWDYLNSEEKNEAEIASLIGNNSYLSGLPADDPRNSSVPSLLPTE